MSISTQDICKKFIKLAKDKDRLLVGISMIDDKGRLDFLNVLELIEEKTMPTEKKLKHQKEDPLLSDKIVINDLKKNLAKSEQYIEYTPTKWSDINEITKLDVKKDIEVIKEIHSMVSKNENNANIFALHEAYCRGKLYDKLKSKHSDNTAFIAYCEKTFKVMQTTVFTYLNFYYLTEEYPNIISSGFHVNKLYRYSKLIRKTAEKDMALKTLLMKTFPGIKTDEIKIEDPIMKDLKEEMKLL
jgi:hypothetical protein